jgi:hypothetical protein
MSSEETDIEDSSNPVSYVNSLDDDFAGLFSRNCFNEKHNPKE